MINWTVFREQNFHAFKGKKNYFKKLIPNYYLTHFSNTPKLDTYFFEFQKSSTLLFYICFERMV